MPRCKYRARVRGQSTQRGSDHAGPKVPTVPELRNGLRATLRNPEMGQRVEGCTNQPRFADSISRGLWGRSIMTSELRPGQVRLLSKEAVERYHGWLSEQADNRVTIDDADRIAAITAMALLDVRTLLMAQTRATEANQ